MLFLIGGLCMEWCLELFGRRNFVIWWRFEEDMKVWRFLIMEILEGSLRDERCLCWRMKEEEGKKLIIGSIGVGHGRATAGTDRANFLEFGGLVWHGQARPYNCRHGPCHLSDIFRLIFFRFLESCSDNDLQNNLKQQKTNKIKTIKCVGCLPRSARLESLAWRLESVLRKDQRDHIV